MLDHIAFDTALFVLLLVLQASAQMLLLRNAFSYHPSISAHHPWPLLTLSCFLDMLYFIAFISNLMLSYLPADLFVICFPHQTGHVVRAELVYLFTPGFQHLPQCLPQSSIHCVRYCARCQESGSKQNDKTHCPHGVQIPVGETDNKKDFTK